jgi:hypothetical protein
MSRVKAAADTASTWKGQLRGLGWSMRSAAPGGARYVTAFTADPAVALTVFAPLLNFAS